MRDDNSQQQIEQEMERAFFEEFCSEIDKLRVNDFNDFVQSHEKAS